MTCVRLLNYNLSPRVTAFSTTRHGGYGRGNYSDFNINLYCGDDSSAIARNREMLCRQLGIDERCLVMPHQTHSTVVRCLYDDFFGLPEASRKAILEGVDALITDVQSVCIGVSTADCIPILLYDEEHHAAGAIHSGWRGTVSNIVEKTVCAMQRQYGTRPECLKAAIGAGIGFAAFEVGDEVYNQFEQAGFPMEKIARRFPPMANTSKDESMTEKWHIDLPGCVSFQLSRAGVTDIYNSGICTWTNVSDFFSARRITVNSGRIFTGIILNR